MHNPAPSERAESLANATAAAGRRPRAVSADSFRLLTAKLKGASSAVNPPQPDLSSLSEPVPAAAIPMVASEAALPEPELPELSGAVIPAAEALPPPVQQAEPPVAGAAWPTSQPESDPELPELPAFPALETTLAGQLPDWQDDPELVAQSLVSPSIAGEPPVEVTAVEDEAVPHQSETALEPPVPLDEPTIHVEGASDAEPALSLLVPEDEPEAVVLPVEPAAGPCRRA